MVTKSSSPAAGLIDACRDPRLFNFNLWPRQAELLRKVEDGPRVHVWALGRRSGKTTMAALACLWDCLLSPDLRRYLRRGERRFAVAVAVNLRQSRLIVEAARTIVSQSPVLASLVESQTDDEIAFTTGASLVAFPCTSRGGRGWPISTLVMDECAHFLDSDGNQSAEQVWRALMPATAQFGHGARIIVASTPYGSDGLFADLWAKADTGELVDATACRYATAEVNPTQEIRDVMRLESARDPDGFRAEYLAEFIGSGAVFLDAERIRDAIEDRRELDPSQASHWVAGLDPAFSSDPFGLAIVGRVPIRFEQQDRLVLGLARAWQPTRTISFDEKRINEDAVLAEVADSCLRYQVSKVYTDQYAASAIVDYLRRRGLSVSVVNMSATSKTEVFGELRARLTMGSLGLYDQPQLPQELRRLRSRYSAGSASVVNPRVGGSHGDIAQALALAVNGQHGVNADTFAGFYKEGRFEATPGSLAAMYYEADIITGAAPLTPDSRL